MEGLPRTKEKYIRLLVFQDSRSKLIQAFPTRNRRTEDVIKGITDTWLKPYGKIDRLHTDNAKEFQSKLFKKFCEGEDITLTHSAPFAHNQNGGVERMMRYFRDQFRIHAEITGTTRSWSEVVTTAIRKYNFTIHSSTGYAPMNLHFRKLAVATSWRPPNQFEMGDPVTIRKDPSDDKFKTNRTGFVVVAILANNQYRVTNGRTTVVCSGLQLQGG
jgi:transposase InsO family protein